MSVVHVRLFEELNQYIPQDRRRDRYKQRFTLTVPSDSTVADILVTLSVPVDEVDLVTIDGRSVSLGAHPPEGAELNVYPVFERFEIGGVSCVRAGPLRNTRFELDIHLGQLARLLRLHGFDATWRPPFDTAGLVERSLREHRILLSRDAGLIRRQGLTHGLLVRTGDPEQQLYRVFDALQLRDSEGVNDKGINRDEAHRNRGCRNEGCR